jgi:hypothetical protein
MTTFVHRPDNKIIINGEVFSIKLFQKIFPKYSLPQGMERRNYEQGKHHYVSDGLKVFHQEVPWHLGDKIISRLKDLISVRNLWEEELRKDQEETIELQKNQRPYQEKRKEEYPPIDDLIVALWEHTIEGRSKKIKEIQEIRKQVKKKYPKKDV